MPDGIEPGLGDLIRDLLDDSRRLLRDEIELAKTEMREKAKHTLRQSLLMIVGVTIALVGVVALMAALTFALAHALSFFVDDLAALWLSPLLIALLAGGVGGYLVWRGYDRLRREPLVPRQTINSIRESSRMLADRVTTNGDGRAEAHRPEVTVVRSEINLQSSGGGLDARER